MTRKPCNNCLGSGKVFDFWSVVTNPANWVPFTMPKNVYVRCPACNGKGYYWQEWQIRPTRLTRRRPR